MTNEVDEYVRKIVCVLEDNKKDMRTAIGNRIILQSTLHFPHPIQFDYNVEFFDDDTATIGILKFVYRKYKGKMAWVTTNLFGRKIFDKKLNKRLIKLRKWIEKEKNIDEMIAQRRLKIFVEKEIDKMEACQDD